MSKPGFVSILCILKIHIPNILHQRQANSFVKVDLRLSLRDKSFKTDSFKVLNRYLGVENESSDGRESFLKVKYEHEAHSKDSQSAGHQHHNPNTKHLNALIDYLSDCLASSDLPW